MTWTRKALVGAAVAALVLTSPGIAHADNTNDNSNTNNNSDVGGYLDTGSGTDDSKNWPPTKLDWPPSDISTAGLSDSGKGGDSGSGKETPIVMPDGHSPPPKEGSDSTSTSTTPTPIVPAGG
jgi:hypothetical protein